MAHPYWPFFDLVVRTPRLELRPVTDEMAPRLAALADPSMFPDGQSQFQLDWLSAPSPEKERSSLQFWWRNRAELTAEHWVLNLAAIVDGQTVGCQDVLADHFPRLHKVKTGSWLGAPFQGQGLGVEMRQAVLHFAFVGLGAREAHSAAFENNARSLAVSRRVGYEENGRELSLRGGAEPAMHINFRMTAESFFAQQRDDIEIEGLEACLEVLGLGLGEQVLGR
jgi:RimJ/RimL family protein N-acetyltransferase